MSTQNFDPYAGDPDNDHDRLEQEPPLEPLQIGDQVEVITEVIYPKLTFEITSFDDLGGQRQACGEYGCFAINLLRKIKPQ